MNNIKQVGIDICTGCGACAGVCPNGSIQMKYDRTGFICPEVLESCIECGKCLAHCHAVNKEKAPLLSGRQCYMCSAKNRTLESKSASGGFCAALAYYFLNNLNGAVFGCVMSEDFSVFHTEIKTVDEIALIQGSKYIQSDTGNTFADVKKYLINKRAVLYTGTPCQIAALKSFLGKPYENLYTVDIICHGVPSNAAFKKYIEYLESKNNQKVKAYSFRNKTRFDRTGYQAKIELGNGKYRYIKSGEELFFSLFSQGKSYRSACYNCKYACPEREGDFTCGDCASRNLHKDFLPFEAASSVIINTEKAAALWDRIKGNFYFRQINIETEIKLNKQLHECTEKPEDRDYICLAMMNGEWDKLKNYTKKPANTGLKTKLLSHMPVSLKKQIYGFMQAVKGKKHQTDN